MDESKHELKELGISKRACSGLYRNGIFTIERLMEYDKEQLKRLKGIGETTVDEILKARLEYKALKEDKEKDSIQPLMGSRTEDWIIDSEKRIFIINYLKRRKASIDDLTALSAKNYNLLSMNGFEYIHEIIGKSIEELAKLPSIDKKAAEDIDNAIYLFLSERNNEIMNDYALVSMKKSERISSQLYQDKVVYFLKANDIDIKDMPELTPGVKSGLIKAGYMRLSDIAFLSDGDFGDIPFVGAKSINKVRSVIKNYLSKMDFRIAGYCSGKEEDLWDDNAIRKSILALYHNNEFGGLSYNDFVTQLQLPSSIDPLRLKKVIGTMIADGLLEYVDYRCYRRYTRFIDWADQCKATDERTHRMILKKMDGETLEQIAGEEEPAVTRERVRQIINKGIRTMRVSLESETGDRCYDEDYYQYLLSTYEIEKSVASEWLGIPEYVFRYMRFQDIKCCGKTLKEALEDRNLDAGIRIKIRNYLYSDMLHVDGSYISKDRGSIESVVIRTLCKEKTDVDSFIAKYNSFLDEHGISPEQGLHLSSDDKKSLISRLKRNSTIWSFNSTFRYYDIESCSCEELWEGLGLSSFENIELSTQKFIDEYPELMRKYDIRNQYELHNLMRRKISDGSYHDMHFCKMPIIGFGTFDRAEALKEVMLANAPISMTDLAGMMHEIYGFDSGAIPFDAIKAFNCKGLYKCETNIMSQENLKILKAALPDDLYYFDEIKDIYMKVVPKGKPEEINTFNLKQIGFIVGNRYAVQHYQSVDALVTDLLTKNELTKISSLKKRFAGIQAFSSRLNALKRELEVIEYDPNQLINIRRLERQGITKEQLRAFCDEVYRTVPENTYFTIPSLQQDGFTSALDKLGFSPFFYSSILRTDERYSFASVFGIPVFRKGKENFSIKTFLVDRINEYRSIDIYDLESELTQKFGCRIDYVKEPVYYVHDTQVYYDPILERLYANIDLYYDELDA